jgi:hypothetical protein
MGWAARAKVRSGNPTHEKLQGTVILATKVHEALRAAKTPFVPVRFSDRTYAIDQHGTLRRLGVASKAGG